MIDTAGIRDTENIVEKIGVEKSKAMLNKADLVLLVLDSSQPLNEEDQELLSLTQSMNRIIVLNKNDKECVVDIDGISISASNNNIEPLVEEIKKMFNLGKLNTEDEVYISNIRHITLLEEAKEKVMSAIDAMNLNIPTDLIVLDLYDAWKALKDILGEEAKEDLLDELFSRFCIGK